MVSDLSDSLTSLTIKEGMSKSLIFLFKKPIQSILKNKILDLFSQNFLSASLICSFIMIDLSESLTVAHLS